MQFINLLCGVVFVVFSQQPIICADTRIPQIATSEGHIVFKTNVSANRSVYVNELDLIDTLGTLTSQIATLRTALATLPTLRGAIDPNYNIFEPARALVGNTTFVVGNRFALLVGDVDGDGDVDVVFLGPGSAPDPIVLLNDGQGQFPSMAAAPNASGFGVIVLGDFLPDTPGMEICVSDGTTLRFYVWNDVESPYLLMDSDPRSASTMIAVDIDGDGADDLLEYNLAARTVGWYRNMGTEFLYAIIRTPQSGRPRDVAAGDMNNDGLIDILVPDVDSHCIELFKGLTNTTFAATPIIIAENLVHASSVAVADLTGNGWLDVIASAQTNDKTAWYRNNGTDVFEEFLISNSTDDAEFVSVADLDMDGDLDVLVASSDDNRHQWFRNNGFSRPFTPMPVIGEFAEEAHFITATDLDGDGDLDVIGEAREYPYWRVYHNTLVPNTRP
eukprot:m.318340 g.318340  ORF g.318340 m.318340 type:complete len:445 (+) comp20289_c0_seq2:122-1456(+)